MTTKKNPINAGSAFLVACVLCGFSFLIAAMTAGTPIGDFLARIWPRYQALQSYCSSNECLVAADYAALVYIFNVVMAAGTFVAISLVGSSRIASRGVLITRAVVTAILVVAGITLTLVPFDFETTQKRFYENSVSWSYLGLTRAAWPSLLAMFLSVAGYMSDKRRLN